MPESSNQQGASDGAGAHGAAPDASPELPSPLQVTSWPEAEPHVCADHLLVVVCGNSRVQWSLHEGYAEGFRPSLFWRTSLFPTEFTADMDPCSLLDSYIPGAMQTVLFGSSDPEYEASVTVSAAHRASKRVPVINVYVVSSHPDQENAIKFLFDDLPCNVYKMRARDFVFSDNDDGNDNGVYPGMGVDRVATLFGAQHLFGSPVLVLDGGTAMTYTGLDEKDRVVGGGICAGLQAKLEALPRHLPNFTSLEILERLKQQHELLQAGQQQQGEQQQEQNSALLLHGFADNTKDALLAAVIREMALNVRGIVSEWAKRLPVDGNDNTDSSTSKPIQVVVTGGDGEILDFILNNHYVNSGSNDNGSLIEGALLPELERMMPLPKNLQVSYQRHLIHLGVARALSMIVKAPGEKTPLERLRSEILGQRVAKQFPGRVDFSGDDIYRGSVASISRGDDSIDGDYFKIYYDDGDKEDVTSTEVHDAMILYSQVGEKVRIKETEEFFLMKSNEAKAVAELLVKQSEAVQSALASRLARQEAHKRALEEQEAALEKPNKPTTSEAEKSGSQSTESQQGEKNAKKSVRDGKHPTSEPSPKKQRGRKSLKRVLEDDPTAVVLQRLAKYFGNDLYFGTITEYAPPEEIEDNEPLWRIVYDDGDEEDLEADELRTCLDLYKKKQKSDPNPNKT